MKALVDFDHALVFGIPTSDGSGVREGMLIEGPQGWGEFSPPPDCSDREAGRWLTAAVEGGTVGWPDPVRGRIPIAVSVPAVDAATARRLVVDSGCSTADVTVAAHPNALARDAARVEAVREALGHGGRIRLSVNGMWTLDTAVDAITALTNAAVELEYVAEPCRSTDDVLALRRRIDVPVAMQPDMADVSDIVILRSAPLGGVRRALRWAERCGLPCVVSSTWETSIGLASGLALAGALAELPFACALNTSLTGDVCTGQRSLVPVRGHLPVAPTAASPDPDQMRRYAVTDAARVEWWRLRLAAARATA